MSQEAFEKMVCCLAAPDFSKIIDYLEEHKGIIDINRVGHVPYTVLERASGHGRLDVVKYLLHYGADINLQSRMVIEDTVVFLSLPPVLYAVEFPDVLEWFVDNGAEYDYQLSNKDHHCNILSAIMVKFAKYNNKIDEMLMLRLIDKCTSCQDSSKQEILQIVLHFHAVLFKGIFLSALAKKGIKFDKDFQFDEMHLMPCNKSYRMWWKDADIVSYLLTQCSNSILDKPLVEKMNHVNRVTTLRDLVLKAGLLEAVIVVQRLSPSNVMYYYGLLKEVGEYNELKASVFRVHMLCFTMYKNFVQKKYHPSSRAVARMIQEWGCEPVEPYRCIRADDQ